LAPSTFVPITLIATTNVADEDAGLASGLFNTSQQVGGALGLAVLSTLAAEKTASVLANGQGRPSPAERASALLDGFTVAFTLGLLMDVAEGTLFGQHALAYSILTFAGIALHRRVRQFSLTEQVFHVVPLFLANDLIVLGIRLLGGADFPGYRYFIGTVFAGLIWPVVSVLLKLPQRPRADPDHV
jgi:rod shape-determining protein MreD